MNLYEIDFAQVEKQAIAEQKDFNTLFATKLADAMLITTTEIGKQ